MCSGAAAQDEAGFVAIFDGRTLNGWEGDPKYWRVENGLLTGEVTPDTLLKRNSFIIWRGGVTKDFELKVEYRITAGGNSGINYRSVELPEQPWGMRGYQADIDGPGRNANQVRHTGQNYEERGRTFLALRGQMVRIDEGQKPKVVGSAGDSKALASFIKNDDWNEYHIIARGSVLVHILNGQVMSVVVDDDATNRRYEGQLGVQVHVGPPMKVEFRRFRLKKL
ncbi:MAG: 3-keto-disaccharide hydrolase [Bryobacteraceae bacterium]